MSPVVRLLAELVAIPSVNPMGRGCSKPPYLETRLTDFLDVRLRGLGVRVDRVPVLPGRDNLIARYEAPNAGRTLLWDVHQDTVPVDGMTIAPFEPMVEQGRLHGRGACDVKGSLAPMLIAFERLCRERPAGSASVILACTVDEEYTHLGSTSLAAAALQADLAIVAEPTGLDIVNTHKGAVRWKIRAEGVACHSSSPERGVNAIYRMAEVVQALQKLAAKLSQGPSSSVLGTGTLSVGRIEGGVSANIVPDWCEIDIDRRLLPGETAQDALEQVARAIGEVEGVTMQCPWVRMPALSPDVGPIWIEALSDVVATVTSRRPKLGGVPFGTDAGPLGEAGLPCVVFGPGDIAQAHTCDEWIETDQVEQAAEIFYRTALASGRL